MSKKIRKGDLVIAIAGNEKGRTGHVLGRKGDRILVQGLNMRKKAVKRSQENPKGDIIEIERPIHISNLQPCTEEGTPVKLKVRANDEGQRELYYQKDGQAVCYRSVK